MNELKLIREKKHKEFLLVQRNKELEERKIKLMEILKNKLEFDEFKRKIYILKTFINKYYKQKFKDSQLYSFGHETIATIPGIRRKHILTDTCNIVFDIYEYPIIIDIIPIEKRDECEKLYKKLNCDKFEQDFEYHKCIYKDTINNNTLNNKAIEKLKMYTL